MTKTTLFQFEIEADKFDHFLKGDGEIYFANSDGVFLTKEELEDSFKEYGLETEEDKAGYMDEYDICKNYNDLDMSLDYACDGDYALEYLKIGSTVVMSMAYRL